MATVVRNQIQTNRHKSNALNWKPTIFPNFHLFSEIIIHLIFILILTLILFFWTKSDDIYSLLLIFLIVLISTSVLLFCVNCCCHRRLSSGAILSPDLVVTQVVSGDPHANSSRAGVGPTLGSPANQLVFCETRPQMRSNPTANSTPLMNCDNTESNRMPTESVIPSAPPITESLPTYEEAIRQNC